MRLESTLKSTFIILLINVMNILVNFLTRKLFIDNIGIVFLGVSSVFSNILTFLSLSELGIHSAITYQFYRPIKENDWAKIKYLVNTFDKLYKKVALFVFIFGFVIMFALPIIINDSELSTSTLSFYFIIQLSATIASYLFASRRTLLFVFQKQYLAALYDALINVIFTVLRIISIVIYKNFSLYLVVNGLQILSSNLFIYYKTRQIFPMLSDTSIAPNAFPIDLKRNLFNTGLSSFANFVYSSTDNIVISTFVGITPVGLISNYKLIPLIINEILTNVFKPVQASIGDLIHDKESKQVQIDTFRIYTYIRFLISNFISMMCLILMHSFISLWFGKEYVMSNSILVLIVIDLYLYIYQGSLTDFIQTYGLFKDDRKLMIRGAILNLIVSIILVQFIGIEGVLIGTLLTQLSYWIARTILVHKKALQTELYPYLRKSFIFFAISLLNAVLLIRLNSFISGISLMNFIISILVGSLITSIIPVLLTFKTHEFRTIRTTYLPILLKLIFRL